MDNNDMNFTIDLEDRKIGINREITLSEFTIISNIMSTHERTLPDFPDNDNLWEIYVIDNEED
jgi:hypothetical protein